MKTYDINDVEQQLKSQDTVAFLTSGVSMYPLLRTHKDIVVIKKPEFPLGLNDVALYKKRGIKKLILHRVIGVSDDGTYIIRGDNTYQKEYIPQNDIVGVMTALYRSGKYIDCQNSKGYNFYIKATKFFYPLRWLWKTKIKVVLAKIKRKLLSD